MFKLSNAAAVAALRKGLETWTLRFLVIGITLILIENSGIAAKIVQSFADPVLTNHFVFEMGIAFTVAAFLILSSERVLKTEMEETFEKYLGEIKQASVADMDDIRNEYRSILRGLSNLHDFSYFLSNVREDLSNSPEMCTLASEILGDYTNGLKSIRDGFIVEERDWWLDVMKRLPLLKNEWVEMGDPAPPRRRTHGGTGAGARPLSSPCRRRRWPEGQALQGPSVPGYDRHRRTDGLRFKTIRSRQASCRALRHPFEIQ
jgi:hypothetical protein